MEIQEQQKSVSSNICLLIEKNFGTFFTKKYQGNTKALELVIVGDDRTKISKANLYLKKLGLATFNRKKGRGRGSNCTIIIALSKVPEDVVANINKEISVVISKAKSNGAVTLQPHESNSADAQLSSGVQPSLVEKDPLPKEGKTLKSLSLQFSSYLKFEGVPTGQFKCTKEGGFFHIECANESIAEMLERLSTWRIGNPSLVCRNDTTVVIDGSLKLLKNESTHRAHFCSPPSKDAKKAEIEKRLRHISSGSIPRVSVLKGNKFLVAYSHRPFVPKMLSLVVSMGWNAVVNEKDERSFILNIGTEITGTELKRVGNVSCSDKDSNHQQTPVAVPALVKDREEAFKELNTLYNDPRLFSKLSKETQQEVACVLKEHWKNENPEDFAKGLLQFLK